MKQHNIHCICIRMTGPVRLCFITSTHYAYRCGHCDDAAWVFFCNMAMCGACLAAGGRDPSPVALKERESVLLKHDTTQTLDGVGWLGNSSILVKDFNLQAPQRSPVQPVPHQEGAVLSVQRRSDVDTDVLLLVQWTYLHFKCVST